MKWYEIIVNTTSEYTELIADVFFTIGCVGGVKIVDKQDVEDVLNSSMLWDYIDQDVFRQSEIAKVSGFVSAEDLPQKKAELEATLLNSGYRYGEITVNEINDESWYDSWKKYYAPIPVGKYFIVPKWINVEPTDGRIRLLIDPGMAFGTGEHESTKLCLLLMSELDFRGKDVIDVGTGSGILGIAAAKSGAKSCYMCDIDGVAVKAATENSALNDVADFVEIESADLLKQQNKIGDIVLANLTADILILLSKDLIRHLRKGGYLVCSGIIHERKQEVIDAFTSVGLTMEQAETKGEWNGLRFRF